MTLTDYTYLINKPDAITEKQTDELGTVLNEFPYFQSARALRLKGLYNQNSFKYNYALKVTAAHTTDRSVLFDFITSDTFTSIQKEYYDEKLHHLLNITVVDSEIILSNEITKTEENNKFQELPEDPVKQSIFSQTDETLTAKEVVKIDEQESFIPEIPQIESEVSAECLPDTTLEITEITNDEQVKLSEEKNTDNKVSEIETDSIEQSILASIKEASTITFEKQEKTENDPAHNNIIIEKSTDIVNESDSDHLNEIISVSSETPKKSAEENLEIGKPLDFSVNETHSFQEWLQLSRTQPIDRTKEKSIPSSIAIPEAKASLSAVNDIKLDDDKKKKEEIINKFIETNPKISPIKQTPITPAVQLNTNEEDNSYLMTETLARVYLEQKKYTKAIQAYEILILKYPEKISFFADRISDIKILQQNNNNN